MCFANLLIHPALLNELAMGASMDNAAAVKDADAICITNRRKTVCHSDGDAISFSRGKCILRVCEHFSQTIRVCYPNVCEIL